MFVLCWTFVKTAAEASWAGTNLEYLESWRRSAIDDALNFYLICGNKSLQLDPSSCAIVEVKYQCPIGTAHIETLHEGVGKRLYGWMNVVHASGHRHRQTGIAETTYGIWWFVCTLELAILVSTQPPEICHWGEIDYNDWCGL